MTRKFVVTGTGRSGTAYTAKIMQAAGLNCPHEGVFLPRQPDLGRFEFVDGDSSWCAAPHLGLLPRDTVVFHQVRDPWKVISSFSQREAFQRFHIEENVFKHVFKRVLARQPSGTYATYRYLRYWCPSAYEECGAAARAARHWIDWNLMVEEGAARAGLEYHVVRGCRESFASAIRGELVRLVGEGGSGCGQPI